MNHGRSRRHAFKRASVLALIWGLVTAAATVVNLNPAAAYTSDGTVYWDDSPTLSCTSSCGALLSVTAWASSSTKGSPWVTSVASTGTCSKDYQFDTGSDSGGGYYYAKTYIAITGGSCSSKFRITFVDAP